MSVPHPEPHDASSCTHPDASHAWGPWGPILSFQPLLALLATFTIGPWVTFVPLGQGGRKRRESTSKARSSEGHLRTGALHAFSTTVSFTRRRLEVLFWHQYR